LALLVDQERLVAAQRVRERLDMERIVLSPSFSALCTPWIDSF
jgi:hypothetical protein